MEQPRETDPPPARATDFLRNAADTSWIERRAKLFEAGEYPDKGLTITRDNLAALCDSFGQPVPVLIEHADSPLELGFLTGVEALGDEMFGILALTEEANALIERSGARSLSLGLDPSLTSIREVSLVRKPRVATAQLYSAGPCFEASWEAPTPNPLPQFPKEQGLNQGSGRETEGGGSEWQRKYSQLLREHAEKEADRRVAVFVAEGKLTPAQAPFAQAMLLCEDSVEFDGDSRPLAHLALALIERQPKHGMFGDRAPALNPDYSQHLMMPEEVAFYERHFPGVSLDEIAKRGKS